MFRLVRLALTLMLGISCMPTVALAQKDLGDISTSRVMSRWEEEARIGRLNQNKGEKWLKPLHNFSRIFESEKSVLLIDSWLGLRDITFKQLRSQHLLFDDFAISKRIFKSDRNNLMKLEVLIPHPRFQFMAQFNLITAFAELEPPRLDVEYTEDIIIQQMAGHLHQHKQKNGDPQLCSILLKLSKEARINIVSTCSATKDMIELANQLSIERFKEKLNS